MDTTPQVPSEKEIPLFKAVLVITLIVAVCLAIGLFVGYRFFWNQFEKEGMQEIQLKNAEELVKKAPDNAMAYANMGLQYLSAGENEKAVQQLEKAYELDNKHIGIRFNLGLAYRESNQPDKALPILDGVVKENPYHFLGIVNLGVVYDQQGEYKKAEEMYKKALVINPGAADVFFLLGKTYAQMGDKQKALENIDQALRFVPDYDEALAAKKEIEGQK